MTDTNIERRVVSAEFRVVREADKPAQIEGYAAVFDSDSVDMGFIERLAPGCFKDALEAEPDVRCLIDHEGGLNTIGRTKSGTLELEEDETGLKSRCTPPDTQAGRDIVTLIERGDISQCSFAFSVSEDSWDYDSDPIRRTITRVGDLVDVSPVTYPAYPDTSVAVRKIQQHKQQRRGYPASVAAARARLAKD